MRGTPARQLPSTQVTTWHNNSTVLFRNSVFSGPATPNIPGRAPYKQLPSDIPDLLGWWDARDVAAGSVTSWPARAGVMTTLTGTGTASGSGATANISQPRYTSTITVASAGLATALEPWSMWFIGTVTSLGDGSNARYLCDIGSPGGVNESGLCWYNASGNVTKIVYRGDITTPADGISQKAINTKYLWILTNRDTVYTYTEAGTATFISTPTFVPATANFFVGRQRDNQSNVLLQGNVNAVGFYARYLTNTDITALRVYANTQFGVVD